MKTLSLLLLSLSLLVPGILCAQDKPGNGDWITLFDGTSLKGWHVSAKSGHSRTSKNTSGGKWEVKDGAIVGSQDVPGNGGLILTDEQFENFEVVVEMNNDFGPDSGLFLRSTEDGKAWQAMIDYHAGGNLMGIYGEGLGGKPHVRNYNFKETPDEIEDKKTGEPPTPLAVAPESWKFFWRHGQWNEFRAQIIGNPPHFTTWINGVKVMEWQEKEVRHPEIGSIALQVHGGGDHTKEFVRYRGIKVRKLGPVAAAPAAPAGSWARMQQEIALATVAGSDLQPVIINVQADGAFKVNQKPMTKEELTTAFAKIASASKKTPIIVRGSKDAAYALVFGVLDAARKAGLHHVSFASEQAASEKQEHSGK